MAVLTPSSLPKILRTKDIRTAYATILAYSVPRFGKTDQIRTLVEHGFKPGILATDQGDSMGLQTISDLDIPVIPISNWDEAQQVFAELNKPRSHGGCEYQGELIDVIVNDSLSGFGSIWMDKGLEALGWEEVGVAERGKDPRRIYAYIPEKGRQTTKALMNCKAHLILICRETMMEEGEGAAKITYPVPELPGAKLPRELPGWLDGVIFGKMIAGQRRWVTEVEGKVVAGVRMPPNRRLPKYVMPSYGLIIKAMMGDDDALARLDPKHPSNQPTDSKAPTVASAKR